jgi:integrase
VIALVQHRLSRQQAIYPAELQPDDDVFLDAYGKSLHPEHLSYRFEELVKSSKLPALTMHGLRHSWATIALKNRVPIKTVFGRLGHKDITVTLRTYQHWLPEDDADAANLVAASFKPSTIDQPNPLSEAVTGQQQA